MSDIAAIILAAGKGTRMKSKLPKALHPLCGKPMTRYIIDACKCSGIDRCIVIVGHGADLVREGLGGDVQYVLQETQCGTGDACRQAIPVLEGFDGDVLVAPGDTPLITCEILSELVNEHRVSGNAATLLTTELEDAIHYGRIHRKDDGCIIGIVEAKDATPEQIKICEINSAIYIFNLPLLRGYLKQLTPANAQNEYYLTDVIGMMANDGYKLGSVITPDSDAVLGINNRKELADQTVIIRKRINERLMLNGVSITDPSSTYIDADAEIGEDTIINPQSYIEGKCRIGSNCVIGPSARLVNMQIGDGVSVLFSNLADSIVGDNVRIGPFAHIRPGCEIGDNSKLGNFVEGKKAIIGENVSIGHLSYIGDASIGEHTNIGAGTITCNYDGYAKHKTTIGKEAFIGSHTTFVAPVAVGDGALTAAGSVITDDVPGDALAIARSPQSVKEGWAKHRRAKMDKKSE